jgi:hypothetical protein
MDCSLPNEPYKTSTGLILGDLSKNRRRWQEIIRDSWMRA